MKCFAFLLDILSFIQEVKSVMGKGKSTILTMPGEVREFHLAVMRNDIIRVQQLVEEGIDVNYPWQSSEPPSVKDGSTPLCEAVSLNHRLIVEELINSGAYVNKPDNFGCTPLHKSSYHGRASLTATLIEAGADVQLCDQNLSTPLVTCAQNFIIHNNVDTVRVLVEAGTNVNAPNRYGKIALHYAVMWGLGEITEVLLQANSNMDCMDLKRKTPLFCCIRAINVLYRKRDVFEQHLPSIKPLVLSGCDTLNLASWLFQNKILSADYHMDEEFYSWFSASRPETLKHLCRTVIQDNIKDENVITKLPLPGNASCLGQRTALSLMELNSFLYPNALQNVVYNPPIADESDKNTKKCCRKNPWGNRSYADLITQAIESSPEKKLTLSQIYDWMTRNVPFFSDKGENNSSAGWKETQKKSSCRILFDTIYPSIRNSTASKMKALGKVPGGR
ncbi:hypothetical protein JTE90_003583 [Oedothorax gibbosus]|uniref:Uncharacterized protein n=1 Tax=Oedothorax gibbosus TaxID=931172 RepID=A0AAV6VJA3_9ARAC|nr:hypothetical protein JTE90_003583 [Oedothorax gibbosus]